ncbi:TNT domain-containing protein [Kutzneria sp. NPDC052558]|uniref:TNT domain-containing protein n=1 Tax=Kutzneria sp. NPDC052558 TaxID=3364121 RepID=UPI0037C70E9B
MSKVNLHPDHLRKSGGKLKDFGGKIEQAGSKLEQAGQNLVSHASGDRSGIGSVVAKAMGRGVEVTGKVFKEGGRVAGSAGGRLGTTADLFEEADTTATKGLRAIHDGKKGKSVPGGSSRSGSSGGSGSGSGKKTQPVAGGGAKPARKLTVSRGKGIRSPKQLASGTDAHPSARGDLRDPAPSGTKVRFLDETGLQQRDPDGKAIPSWQLKHPKADLVDSAAIEKAQLDPGRQGIVDRPGRPASDPEVQKLTTTYAGTQWRPYHADDPQAEQKWQHDYVTKVDPATGKPKDYRWPDPDTQPNGFDSPEERHPAVIESGSVIDRFGKADGRFLSPTGTPYEQRGLPPQNLDDGYHQYQVLKDIPVWAGKIAPAMGQPGGGVQYLSPSTVADLIISGHLKEI